MTYVFHVFSIHQIKSYSKCQFLLDSTDLTDEIPNNETMDLPNLCVPKKGRSRKKRGTPCYKFNFINGYNNIESK